MRLYASFGHVLAWSRVHVPDLGALSSGCVDPTFQHLPLRFAIRRPRRGSLVVSPVLPGRLFGSHPAEPRATGVWNLFLVKIGVRTAPYPFLVAGAAPWWKGGIRKVAHSLVDRSTPRAALQVDP